jgi:transposase
VTAAAKRWQVHVAGWARSGLSCKEYAAQVGVHPGTQAAWGSKLRQAGSAVPTFVEVSEPLAIVDEPKGEMELGGAAPRPRPGRRDRRAWRRRW